MDTCEYVNDCFFLMRDAETESRPSSQTPNCVIDVSVIRSSSDPSSSFIRTWRDADRI